MSMNAKEARQNSEQYIAGLAEEHRQWSVKHNKEQAALLEQSLKDLWPGIKEKIDASISAKANAGQRQLDASHGTGDVFYFDTYGYTGNPKIRVLWEYAKSHYTGLGYKVQEYAGCGLHLSW